MSIINATIFESGGQPVGGLEYVDYYHIRSKGSRVSCPGNWTATTTTTVAVDSKYYPYVLFTDIGGVYLTKSTPQSGADTFNVIATPIYHAASNGRNSGNLYAITEEGIINVASISLSGAPWGVLTESINIGDYVSIEPGYIYFMRGYVIAAQNKDIRNLIIFDSTSKIGGLGYSGTPDIKLYIYRVKGSLPTN